MGSRFVFCTCAFLAAVALGAATAASALGVDRKEPPTPRPVYARLPVSAWTELFRGRAPEGFVTCDFPATTERAARAMADDARASRTVSRAGIHPAPEASVRGAGSGLEVRLGRAPAARRLELDLRLPVADVADDLVTEVAPRSRAIAELPRAEGDEAGGLYDAISAVLPESALVGSVVRRTTYSARAEISIRVYAVVEPEAAVLAALDGLGAEGVRASCHEEGVLGWAWETAMRPGFGHRRASVAVSGACTGPWSGYVEIWTRRLHDTTLVFACRDVDCGPTLASMRLGR